MKSVQSQINNTLNKINQDILYIYLAIHIVKHVYEILFSMRKKLSYKKSLDENSRRASRDRRMTDIIQ